MTASAPHCTSAVTEAFPLRVNVHDRRLSPPVLPTATLMPAGLEVIRSPLRPVAVTVNVAVCPGGAGGVTVSVLLRVVRRRNP